LDDLLPKYLNGKNHPQPNLRKLCVERFLVCVDNAAWLLYAAENNLHQFDEMIPVAYQQDFRIAIPGR
jgi:hypothetical protein